MRRVVFDIWSICGSGYWFTSITSSRKRVQVWMVALYSSQSKLTWSPSWRMKQPRLIEPRLQES